MKTIFIGTPEFGVPSLKSLLRDAFFDVQLVISQPDKKIGRKQILSVPPVIQAAKEFNIRTLQPFKIAEALPVIKDVKPDIIIVIAYAQIIPKEILDLPKYGCVNVHGSLLPRCRGAACVQWPIIDGDKETGITIMKMDKGLDTGPIIAQHSIEIKNDDNASSVFDKLSKLGAEHIANDLKKYINGLLIPHPQPSNGITCVKTLKKEDGKINWQNDAEYIERFIRGMNPWPGAYSFLNKKMIKIIETENDIVKINKYQPGTIFCNKGNLLIQCGKNAIQIKIIQMAGKKPVDAQAFQCGNKEMIARVLK